MSISSHLGRNLHQYSRILKGPSLETSPSFTHQEPALLNPELTLLPCNWKASKLSPWGRKSQNGRLEKLRAAAYCFMDSGEEHEKRQQRWETRVLSWRPFCPSRAWAWAEAGKTARRIPTTETLALHATAIASDSASGQLGASQLRQH